MFWLHIPKCGTSFYNTVTHLPGMCPDLPVNLSMGDESVWGKCFETHFRALCPTLCDQKLLHCDWPPTATHQFLVDSKYEEYKGHFVGLFRQPEQRLLSAYHDDKDLFRSDPFIPACSNETMTKELSMEAVPILSLKPLKKKKLAATESGCLRTVYLISTHKLMMHNTACHGARANPMRSLSRDMRVSRRDSWWGR